MSLTKKPRVFMKFKKLKHETTKAYLFIDTDREEVWMPKSICKIIKQNQHSVDCLVAPFKYEELSGNEIQTLDIDLKWKKPPVKVPDIDIYISNKYKLLNMQKEAVNFILTNKVNALFAETRTGKTIISLTCAKSREIAGVIDNTIVICPVRIMQQWDRYCKDFNLKNYKIYGTEHFSNANTRQKTYLELKEILNKKSMVIIDESHLFKNPNTERSEYLNYCVDIDCFKTIMTGTPVGKHLGDLYNQFKILDETILNYNSYSDFEESHLLYGGKTGKSVVGYINIEEFAYSLESYIFRLKRKDVLKDREEEKKVVKFRMDDHELRVYQDFINNYVCTSEIQKLGLMVKMQQITAVCNSRITALKKVIKSRPVIFFKFIEEGEKIKKELKGDYRILSGNTSKKEFDKAITEYNDFKIDGLIVNQTLAIGFDLNTAEQIIFNTSVFDMIAKNQAHDRAMNMFSNSKLECVELVCENSIDIEIYNCIEKKENIKKAFYKEIKKYRIGDLNEKKQ